MMRKFNKAFAEKLEQEIAAIEKQTSVELVVAIVPESDSHIEAFSPVYIRSIRSATTRNLKIM